MGRIGSYKINPRGDLSAILKQRQMLFPFSQQHMLLCVLCATEDNSPPFLPGPCPITGDPTYPSRRDLALARIRMTYTARDGKRGLSDYYFGSSIPEFKPLGFIWCRHHCEQLMEQETPELIVSLVHRTFAYLRESPGLRCPADYYDDLEYSFNRAYGAPTKLQTVENLIMDIPMCNDPPAWETLQNEPLLPISQDNPLMDNYIVPQQMHSSSLSLDFPLDNAQPDAFDMSLMELAAAEAMADSIAPFVEAGNTLLGLGCDRHGCAEPVRFLDILCLCRGCSKKLHMFCVSENASMAYAQSPTDWLCSECLNIDCMPVDAPQAIPASPEQAASSSSSEEDPNARILHSPIDLELSAEPASESQAEEGQVESSGSEEEKPQCRICGIEENLFECYECQHSYHLGCLNETVAPAPGDLWFCAFCDEQTGHHGELGHLFVEPFKCFLTGTKTPSIAALHLGAVDRLNQRTLRSYPNTAEMRHILPMSDTDVDRRIRLFGVTKRRIQLRKHGITAESLMDKFYDRLSEKLQCDYCHSTRWDMFPECGEANVFKTKPFPCMKCAFKFYLLGQDVPFFIEAATGAKLPKRHYIPS